MTTQDAFSSPQEWARQAGLRYTGQSNSSQAELSVSQKKLQDQGYTAVTIPWADGGFGLWADQRWFTDDEIRKVTLNLNSINRQRREAVDELTRKLQALDSIEDALKYRIEELMKKAA